MSAGRAAGSLDQIERQPVQRAGKGREVAERHELGLLAVTHDFWDCPDASCHNGQAGRHRFGQDDAVTFVTGGEHEGVGGGVQGG